MDNGACTDTSGAMYYETDTCQQLGGKPAGNGRAGYDPGSLLQDDGGDYNAMLIAPNPAKERAMITYRFIKGSNNRSIELIDITGRRLESYEPENDRGSIDQPLDGYAAGMYQVVMRRNRQVVEQAKLSVTK